jgi:hypothetical protein
MFGRTYVVGLGAVELLDEIRVVVKELGELGSVLAASNHLVHGVVWWSAVVWRVVGIIVVRIVRRMMRPVVGRVVGIIMPVVRVIQSLFERLQLRLKPGLGIKGSVLDLVADAVSLGKGCVESILGLLSDVVPDIL